MLFSFAFDDGTPAFQSKTLLFFQSETHFKTIFLSELKEILQHHSIFQRD